MKINRKISEGKALIIIALCCLCLVLGITFMLIIFNPFLIARNSNEKITEQSEDCEELIEAKEKGRNICLYLNSEVHNNGDIISDCYYKCIKIRNTLDEITGITCFYEKQEENWETELKEERHVQINKVSSWHSKYLDTVLKENGCINE